MNKFNWTKALGFGLLIWAIMFALGALAAYFSFGLGVWTMLVLAVVAAFVAYGFALNAAPETTGQAISYGVVFAAIGLLLDLLISNALSPGIFGVWTYWLGYLFILGAPAAAISSQTAS